MRCAFITSCNNKHKTFSGSNFVILLKTIIITTRIIKLHYYQSFSFVMETHFHFRHQLQSADPRVLQIHLNRTSFTEMFAANDWKPCCIRYCQSFYSLFILDKDLMVSWPAHGLIFLSDFCSNF
jgi:hypothetical protein